MKLILFLVYGILSGCSRYYWGIPNHNLVQSIYVEPVKNSSLCPKASGSLSVQLAKRIQQNTPIKLASKEEAQSHLRVEIVDFSQRNSSYDPKDTAIVLSMNFRAVAECTLIDKNGKPLWEDQRVEVVMDVGKEKDFHSFLDQAIPQVMERLARRICMLLGTRLMTDYFR